MRKGRSERNKESNKKRIWTSLKWIRYGKGNKEIKKKKTWKGGNFNKKRGGKKEL